MSDEAAAPVVGTASEAKEGVPAVAAESAAAEPVPVCDAEPKVNAPAEAVTGEAAATEASSAEQKAGAPAEAATGEAPPSKVEAKEGGEPKAASGTPGKAATSGAVVAGMAFEHKAQLMERAMAAGKKLADGELLKGQDQFLLYAMLERHPSALEKMAGGVTGLGFGTNPSFPDTQAFYVLHDDGASKSYFSLRKAADNVFGDAPLTGFKRKAAEVTPSFPPGCIVQIKGLPEDMHFRDVQTALTDYKVKFIIKLPTEGFGLRFDEADHASHFVKSEHAKNLCDRSIETALVTGEQEVAIWTEMQAGKKPKGGKKGGKKGWRQGSKR
ncbi:hypothetical protein DIPPA_07680 [Diplonema papillatum]|nr:hypothetical protein DIPPA_07680 [Diplonema papillatum]